MARRPGAAGGGSASALAGPRPRRRNRAADPGQIDRQIARSEQQEAEGGEQRRLAHDDFQNRRKKPRQTHDFLRIGAKYIRFG